MNRDIYYSKLGVQVAERLKTYDFKKQGNIRKISNLGDAQPTPRSKHPAEDCPTKQSPGQLHTSFTLHLVHHESIYPIPKENIKKASSAMPLN